MADRHDPRGMMDNISGRLPPGTTIDDGGQLVFQDTGEPVKSNPWKLQRLLEIVGLAAPAARGVGQAAGAAPSTDAAMQIANRVAPSQLTNQTARQAISGPPPAALGQAAEQAALPAAQTTMPASSSAGSALPQMQPRLGGPAASPGPDLTVLRGTPPAARPIPNASEVMPPPRLVGGEAAENGAGPWVTGSRTNEMERAAAPAAGPAGSFGGSNINAARAALAIASHMATQGQAGQQGVSNGPSPPTSDVHRGPDQSQRFPPSRPDLSQVMSQIPTRDVPMPQARPQQDVPMPPRRPADLPSGRPDYQSNSRQVVDNGKLNWGDEASAADFVRASNALRSDPSLSGYARGGGVHPEVAHALAIIRRHLGLGAIAALFVLGSLFAGLSSGPALAHDKWWNGREIDPATRRYCCGDNDVKHLDKEQVHITAQGYKLDDTGETVPFGRAQPSVDGEYWVFRWGSPEKQTQCFFAPTPTY